MLGAAIACPDRPVIAFQADGSGMYTVQSLWTQAREGLDVTTVVCANREYRILRVELGRADIASPGPQAQSVTSLADPVLGDIVMGDEAAPAMPLRSGQTKVEDILLLG